MVVDTILPLTGKGLRINRRGRLVLDVPEAAFGAPGITTILGPNGAGKTLLLRTMTGLLAPDEGSVLWAGREPSRARYRRLGLIAQKPVLLRRSARANLTFALRRSGHDRQAAQSRADIALAGAHLQTVASSPARQLSGGEQHRLALARAISLDPEILLLDEPTASLDPAATLAIEQTVRLAAKSGSPVVLVTHEIAQAQRIADRVIFMHAGRIIEQSDAKAFFAGPATEEAQAYLDGKILV